MMGQNKKIIAFALILLMIISVGYAALTTTLTINGTANVDMGKTSMLPVQ